jgi:hypothetical protein
MCCICGSSVSPNGEGKAGPAILVIWGRRESPVPSKRITDALVLASSSANEAGLPLRLNIILTNGQSICGAVPYRAWLMRRSMEGWMS